MIKSRDITWSGEHSNLKTGATKQVSAAVIAAIHWFVDQVSFDPNFFPPSTLPREQYWPRAIGIYISSYCFEVAHFLNIQPLV